jgi:RNase adaptor protein for sRNA GlmZ degradation
MQDFLNAVSDIIDISVEEYICRGFSNLSVNFGCTGGQHRSVYAADALAVHLKQKYKVKVNVCHLVQEAKGWKNEMPLTPEEQLLHTKL